MNEVKPPLNPFLQNGSQFAHQPVAGPIGRSRQRRALGPNAERKNLRWIQPWNGTPRVAEGGIVYHDKDDDQPRRPRNVEEDEVRDKRQRYAHGNGAREQDQPTTPGVDNVPWRDRGKEIGNAVDSGHQDCVVANPTGRFEDIGCVVGDDVDAVELSEGLCRHGDKDPGSIALEHVTVCSLAFLSLQENIHLDLAVLIARLGVVDITTAVQIGDNNNAFLVMVVVQEPSRV